MLSLLIQLRLTIFSVIFKWLAIFLFASIYFVCFIIIVTNYFFFINLRVFSMFVYTICSNTSNGTLLLCSFYLRCFIPRKFYITLLVIFNFIKWKISFLFSSYLILQCYYCSCPHASQLNYTGYNCLLKKTTMDLKRNITKDLVSLCHQYIMAENISHMIMQ